MQNIGGENAGDAFYRYKMPKLVAKVRGLVGSMGVSCVVPHQTRLLLNMHASLQIEGRGNGIKTNVVNNVDIAKSLERPPECE